jgi:hypothetical protein
MILLSFIWRSSGTVSENIPTKMLVRLAVLPASILTALLPTCSASGPELIITQIADQKFCKGLPGAVSNERLPPGAITLRVLAQMALLNQASVPLIVPTYYKYSALAVRVVGRNSSANNRSRMIKFDVHEAPRDELPANVSPDRVFGKWFVTIAPHQSRDDIVLWLVLRLDDLSGAGDLRGSTVSLQTDLSFDVLTPKLTRELSMKWRQYGTLWTGTARSAEIVVDIPRSPKIADCSHLYHID